ncbi:MAG TPA: hypothetical protein VHR45_19980 [Thermoanaerobaculia bacterium]|nr:hypothetical protein [Thermoanaerobaculia bacterium]
MAAAGRLDGNAALMVIREKILEVQDKGYCMLRAHFARAVSDACREAFWPVLLAYLKTDGFEPNRGQQRHFLPMPFAPGGVDEGQPATVRARRRSPKTVLCGLGVALVLLGPRAAVAEITVGTTVDVPWLAGAQFHSVSVAVLQDGSFAVAGSVLIDPSLPYSFSQLLVQFFDANGSPRGEPVGLPGAVGGVGSLGDHYLVAWSFTTYQSRAAFYSREGTRFGKTISLPYSAIPDFHFYYRYGRWPSFSFLPITYYQNGFEPSRLPMYQPTFQVFGPDAQPLGPSLRLTARRRIYLDDAAINGSGSFVVLWEECSRDFETQKPCVRGMQIFDQAGQPRTPFLTQGIAQYVSSEGGFNGRFAAGIGPQGQVLLTWVTDIFKPVSQLVARLYDQQGSAISAVLPVAGAEVPGPDPLPKGVQVLDDGNFVLSWEIFSPRDGVTTIFLRELATSSQKLAEPVIVVRGALDGRWLELNGAGRGVVVWRTQEQVPTGPIHAHLSLITVDCCKAARGQTAGAR